jgi:hypothetical protein
VKDVLTREKEHVYPALEIDTVYGPEHETTIHIRSLLEDAFLGGVMLLPLTDVEYVSYKLREYGATILWGTARPRIAGTWQRLLRGQKGIHMSVTPKPGTAMEYLHEDTGKICFVERVLDNEVLEVSAVGLYVEGQYTYETLQKEAWRELRPVFIEVIGHA